MDEQHGHPSPGHAAAVSVRRLVNDEIANTARRFDGYDGKEFEFLCECGDLACKVMVWMTLAEYELRAPGSVVGHNRVVDGLDQA